MAESLDQKIDFWIDMGVRTLCAVGAATLGAATLGIGAVAVGIACTLYEIGVIDDAIKAPIFNNFFSLFPEKREEVIKGTYKATYGVNPDKNVLTLIKQFSANYVSLKNVQAVALEYRFSPEGIAAAQARATGLVASITKAHYLLRRIRALDPSLAVGRESEGGILSHKRKTQGYALRNPDYHLEQIQALEDEVAALNLEPEFFADAPPKLKPYKVRLQTQNEGKITTTELTAPPEAKKIRIKVPGIDKEFMLEDISTDKFDFIGRGTDKTTYYLTRTQTPDFAAVDLQVRGAAFRKFLTHAKAMWESQKKLLDAFNAAVNTIVSATTHEETWNAFNIAVQEFEFPKYALEDLKEAARRHGLKMQAQEQKRIKEEEKKQQKKENTTNVAKAGAGGLVAVAVVGLGAVAAWRFSGR